MTGTAARVLWNERTIALAALITVALGSWIYLLVLGGVAGAPEMAGHSSMAGHGGSLAAASTYPWSAADIGFALFMWSVMMLAMMTPSATPMVLTFTALDRRRHAKPSLVPATTAFFAGYVAVWTGFSVGATLLQWSLHSVGLLTPDTMRVTPRLGALLLVLAGLYQFAPLKRLCLSRCRAPLDFLMTEWRDGSRGALTMGWRHGLYCVGCCWSLMLLLFVAGVMNLLWVALLAGYLLLEKTLPVQGWVDRTAGVVAISGGGWLFAQTLLR